MPPIVYVSGHSPGPAGAKADYQHHGIWFARNGFVAFVLDTIEFGEIPGIHHGIHNLGMWHWLSLGYTPAGVEVWNAIRALDYLETRPEVDASRAGMTGRSGGGAITWFTAAVDERFKAAAPVHGTWTVGPHVAGDSVRENCDCIYFWNTYQIDLPLAGGPDRSTSVEDRQCEQGRDRFHRPDTRPFTSACVRSTNGTARRTS